MFLDRAMVSGEIKKNTYWVQSKQRTETFTVAHYAGTVTYQVDGFCEKNRDMVGRNPKGVGPLQRTETLRLGVGVFTCGCGV